ncbi:hypothetical protein RRG08_012798 [Elysia crispata]|uniref:Uncharacterized protein n=1 Tax=Elysia crispata TaxID=231223 RepID=A0AAE0Z1Y6_9GAST|nr:hypothetical protein RRG08_012798 [Elysia crispata]
MTPRRTLFGGRCERHDLKCFARASRLWDSCRLDPYSCRMSTIMWCGITIMLRRHCLYRTTSLVLQPPQPPPGSLLSTRKPRVVPHVVTALPSKPPLTVLLTLRLRGV